MGSPDPETVVMDRLEQQPIYCCTRRLLAPKAGTTWLWLEEHFAPHLEFSLPRAFEAAIYGEVRSTRETFDDFVIRMEHAFKELERQGVKLGDIVLGYYVMFRNVNLSESQESHLLTWGEGKYGRATVLKGLRRLHQAEEHRLSS